MATNYQTLITEVQDYLHRADATTARVDGWIDQVENYFNNNIRVNEMETTNGALTVSNGVITHPSDFLGWKNISYVSNGTRIKLQPTTQEQAGLNDDGTTGPPKKYYVRGGQTVLVPTPDATYTYSGTYYQRIPGLGSSTSTNWLINNYAETYLYGVLTMAMGFFSDDPRVNTWKQYWDVSVNGIKQAQTDRNWGQVGTMQVDYPTY